MPAETFLVKILRKPEEVDRALSFINEIAFKYHRCAPPPPPQVLFGVYAGDAIVGTAGLDFTEPDTPFPLEKKWQFDRTKTPVPFRRGEFVQIGRWMATMAGAAHPLLCATARYARVRGCRYYFAEAKHKIIQVLTTGGYRSLHIEDARILMDAIPAAGRGYYTDNPPELYMFDLEHMESVAVARLEESGITLEIAYS